MMRRARARTWWRLLVLGCLAVGAGASAQEEELLWPRLRDETYPHHDRPDPAVVDLAASPRRTTPGGVVELVATVANLGTGEAVGVTAVFRQDGEERARVALEPISWRAATEARAEWAVEEPGRRRITVELEVAGVDFDTANDVRSIPVFVDGDADLAAQLEVGEPEVSPPVPEPGRPASFRIRLVNRGFTTVDDPLVVVRLDGEEIYRRRVDSLDPEAERTLRIPWARAEAGGHLLGLAVSAAGKVDLTPCRYWQVLVPDETVIHTTPARDQWVSLGPRILDTGSVGRMDRLAQVPGDPLTLYAGAPSGGVWKTTDGGDSWKPLTDKLPHPRVGDLVVDPQHVNVVYAALGEPNRDEGPGIFKTTDGGLSWHSFGALAQLPSGGLQPIAGVRRLVLRRTAAGQILLYATTKNGLLRWAGTDPMALKTQPADWKLLIAGRTADIAPDPDDPLSFVLPVQDEKGTLLAIRRSQCGFGTISCISRIDSKGLPIGQKVGSVSVAYGGPSPLLPSLPRSLYAAIFQGGRARVYVFEPATKYWRFLFSVGADYNDFLRVRGPYLYLGGVWLRQAQFHVSQPPRGFTVSSWSAAGTPAGHADMKEMQVDVNAPAPGLFGPWPPYYVLNDGGIFYCDSPYTGTFAGIDRCRPRNGDLRTTMFYDLDASPTEPDLTIGGTQDNGTVLYTGGPVWNEIKGGDGNYSLIGPGPDPLLYGQHQCLNDDDGMSRREGGTWVDADQGLLPRVDDYWCWGKGQMAIDRQHPCSLIAQGPEVYATSDCGKQWNPVGPPGKQGDIARVAMHPSENRWIVGTSTGQLWERDNAWCAAPFFTHPDRARVRAIAFSEAAPDRLLVAFDKQSSDRRIYRFEHQGRCTWAVENVTDNFPCNRGLISISGDGYDPDMVYVGTDRGVFRRLASAPVDLRWRPYDDGLPWVPVKDLLVDPVSRQLIAGTWGRGAWSVLTRP